MGCPRRVSLCRMQLPEGRFDLPLRRGLGTEGQSWLRGHGCGLGAEGLRAPNPASPRMRTPVECDLGARNPQQSSRAQGSRGSPAQLRPMERGGPDTKMDSIAFLSGGTLGLCFAAPAEFHFAECSTQKLILGNRCDGASELSGRAGSGGMAGAWAQKTFARPILLPKEGEPVGSGFQALETPSKAAVPRSQGELSSASPYGERRAGGENSLC